MNITLALCQGLWRIGRAVADAARSDQLGFVAGSPELVAMAGPHSPLPGACQLAERAAGHAATALHATPSIPRNLD